MASFVLSADISHALSLWVRWPELGGIAKAKSQETLEWLKIVVPFVGGAIGGLVGGFISKRGEIRAIKSDLRTVMDNTAAIQRATQNVDQSFWHLQQLWDMKRDIGIEAMKQTGIIYQVLVVILAAAESFETRKTEEGGKVAFAVFEEASKGYQSALSGLYQANATMELAFSQTVLEKMLDVQECAREAFALTGEDKFDMPRAKAKLQEFRQKQHLLGARMSEDMKTTPLPATETPRS